jgi:hypothetical protein
LAVFLAVAGIGFLNGGFVRQEVESRRRLGGELRRELAAEEVRARASRRRDFVNRLQRRRGRGQGWAGRRRGELKVTRLSFGREKATAEGSGKANHEKRKAGLSPRVIGKKMDSYRSKIGLCLLRQGVKAVDIKLLISPRGDLKEVETGGRAAVRSCVRRVLRGINFPQSDGSDVTAHYEVRVQ